MRWPLRQRAQQTRSAAELASQLRGVGQRWVQNMLRAIGQPSALSALEHTVEDVEVVAEPVTLRAVPETLLTTMRERPALDLDQLPAAADDQDQPLARDPERWRAGHFLDGIDEPSPGSRRPGPSQGCFHRS